MKSQGIELHQTAIAPKQAIITKQTSQNYNKFVVLGFFAHQSTV